MTLLTININPDSNDVIYHEEKEAKEKLGWTDEKYDEELLKALAIAIGIKIGHNYKKELTQDLVLEQLRRVSKSALHQTNRQTLTSEEKR